MCRISECDSPVSIIQSKIAKKLVYTTFSDLISGERISLSYYTKSWLSKTENKKKLFKDGPGIYH